MFSSPPNVIRNIFQELWVFYIEFFFGLFLLDKLCEINDLEKRLDLLLVIMEFPQQFEDLAPVSIFTMA